MKKNMTNLKQVIYRLCIRRSIEIRMQNQIVERYVSPHGSIATRKFGIICQQTGK